MKFQTELDPLFILKLNNYINNGNGFCRYTEKGNRFHAFIIGRNLIDLHFDRLKHKDGKVFHLSRKWDCLQRLKKEMNRIKSLNCK